VRPDAARDALDKLELDALNGSLGKEAHFEEWRSKCLAVLRASLGASSDQVREFRTATTVKNEGYTLSGGSISTMEAWRQDAVNRGRGVLRAAIYALDTLTNDSLLDDVSLDPELWAHVQGLVADDDWAKVPAAVAIFLEDQVRTWAGDPRDGRGELLVGTGLYGVAMNPDGGPLRLGGQGNEHQGWRFLGQGLAQAIGNVDRHYIQRRPDVKRYAMGVLGLGSVLLTQLRFEHPARILQAEPVDEDPEV
jgi:hypothetical protein